MDFKNEISELIINSVKRANNINITNSASTSNKMDITNSDSKTNGIDMTEEAEQTKNVNAKELNVLNEEDIVNSLETPKDKKNGDVSFPCFKLAKILKRSPIEIANIIKENIDIENTVVSKIDIVNGFLNFKI